MKISDAIAYVGDDAIPTICTYAARSIETLEYCIKKYGTPRHIIFGQTLGGVPVQQVVERLIDLDQHQRILPANFTYEIADTDVSNRNIIRCMLDRYINGRQLAA